MAVELPDRQLKGSGSNVRGERLHLVDELSPQPSASIRRVDDDLVEFDDKSTVGQGGLRPVLKPGKRVAAHRTVGFRDKRAKGVRAKRLAERADDCCDLWWLEPLRGNLMVHLLYDGVQCRESGLVAHGGRSDGHEN